MNKYKGFNHPWHLAHQFELNRIPNVDWDWLVNHRRHFASMPRGPKEDYNFNWVPHYEKGKYDFALLHLDQQCLEPSLLERGKGSLFRELNKVITDVPKIVLMHGTPYYPEMFSCDITHDNYKKKGYTKHQIGMSSALIDIFKHLTRDCSYFIFNSKTAQRQWGFENHPNAKTIWHGMKEDEWFDLPKEPRVTTMISPGGLDKYYDRIFLAKVKEELSERNIEHCHITVDAKFKDWTEYREFLGRSLVYFNPTRHSPMPRSRTEAMFSGCCVVSTFNQDSEEFLVDGENSFKALRNPKYVADLIEGLIYDYKKAITIGQKGRETALKLFSLDAFLGEWSEVLKKVIK